MKFFIDESGVFAKPSNDTASVSCIGVLVIPDCSYKKVLKKYDKLRKNLKKTKGEVKGKDLKEFEVARIVEMLRRNDVLFEVNAIDMNLEDITLVETHKLKQGKKLLSSLTDEHHSNLIKGIKALQEQMRKMSIPLYTQFTLETDLLNRAFHHSILYYSQRQPKELSNFQLVVDAKQKNGVTSAEDMWKKLLMPHFSSRTIHEPLILLKGADYSYLDIDKIEEPEWLVSAAKRDNPNLEIKGSNFISMPNFFKDMQFISEINYGLELVDILTNAVRRALMGNLEVGGWKDISRIIIHKKGNHRINLFSFSQMNNGDNLPYARVMHDFDKGGKSMVVNKRSIQ